MSSVKMKLKGSLVKHKITLSLQLAGKINLLEGHEPKPDSWSFEEVICRDVEK